MVGGEVWEDKEGGVEVVEGGRSQGQEEPMEMQIASLNSIARLSFDVKWGEKRGISYRLTFTMPPSTPASYRL